MSGWIKLHRQIRNHWLWKSDRRFRWWIDLLLTVNFEDNVVNIGNQLIECKRGQSVKSLETWAKEWNISKHGVKNFFNLLEMAEMILVENLKFTTRITICKYDEYQGEGNGKGTTQERTSYTKGISQESIKEVNENKEYKERKGVGNEEKISPLTPLHDAILNKKRQEFKETLEPYLEEYGEKIINDFFQYWTQPNKKNTKLRHELEKFWGLDSRLSAWCRNIERFGARGQIGIIYNYNQVVELVRTGLKFEDFKKIDVGKSKPSYVKLNEFDPSIHKAFVLKKDEQHVERERSN